MERKGEFEQSIREYWTEKTRILDWEYPLTGKVLDDDVKDLKAHSYSIYPYQAHVLNTEGRGIKEYIFDFVEKAWASATSGLIQIGIK